VKNVSLGVKDELDASLQERLSNAIKCSSRTLRALSIDHQGNLCKLIVEVGGQCNNLVVLRSGREEEESYMYPPDEDYETLEFLSSWKASLKTLNWTSGDENLACNDALLERLRGAREVVISSTELTSSWTVKLLSSNPRLETLALRSNEGTQVDNIPPMSLPNLDHLYLDPPPKSTQTGHSSLFFKNLDAPRLKVLQFDHVNPQIFLSSELHLLSSSSSSTTFRSQILPLPKQPRLLLSTRSRTG